MNTGAAPKRTTKKSTAYQPSAVVQAKAPPRHSEDIEANTFYKIVFVEGLNQNEQKKAIAKALEFTQDKEQNKARQKEFQAFMEWAQETRKNISREVINLTDTETFAVLKTVYDRMNNDLIDFENAIKPLVECVEALHRLRIGDESGSKTMDAFREIRSDREREQTLTIQREDFNRQIDKINEDILAKEHRIAELQNDKSWFGFGGTKKSALIAIDQARYDLDQLQIKLHGVGKEIEALGDNDPESALIGFENEKAALRQFLEITGDEHKERQQALVNRANDFINSSDESLALVRTHLEKADNMIGNLKDAGEQMSGIYAIMDEGIKEAEKTNGAERVRLAAVPEPEDTITKMALENDKQNLDAHIEGLVFTKTDVAASLADLTTQNIRVKAMKDSNTQQSNKARLMQTRGVAGVAERLSVILNAVSIAALSESAEAGGNTLNAMNQSTNEIAQKQVIRNALGNQGISDELSRAIDELTRYTEATVQASEINRQALSDIRTNMESLEATQKDAQAKLHEAYSVAAEVNADVTDEKKPHTPAPMAKRPFANLGQR